MNSYPRITPIFSLSSERALGLTILAIGAFVTFLYSCSLSGILTLVCRTGEIVLRSDEFMPLETFLLFCGSICVCFVFIQATLAILRNKQ